MRAAEIVRVVAVATNAGAQSGSYEEQENRKNRWLQQFAAEFGTDEAMKQRSSMERFRKS